MSTTQLVCVCVCVCVFVAIGIQHAFRIRHIATCGLPRSTTFFPHYLIKGTVSKKKKKLLNVKCVIPVSLQLLSETFFTPRRIKRDMIKNLY